MNTNILPLNGRRIALVGGAGFIGHNLALELKALGADVHVIDGLNVNNLLYLNQTNLEIQNRDWYISLINERLSLLRENNIPLYIEDARDYLGFCGPYAKSCFEHPCLRELRRDFN